MLLFTFKVMREPYKLPSVFQNYFTTNSNVHTYATRSRSNTHMNRHSTTYGQRCLKYKGAHLWNNLPERLKMQASVNELRVLLRQHLVNEHCWWRLLLFLSFYFLLSYYIYILVYYMMIDEIAFCVITVYSYDAFSIFSVSNNSISISIIIAVQS